MMRVQFIIGTRCASKNATLSLPSRRGSFDLRYRKSTRSMALVILVALLIAPIFGHGCHGDDVDHEPAVVTHKNQPDSPP
jgi:hypothetical protein